MEEGDKSTFFNGPTGGDGNIEEVIKGAEVITNNTSESTESSVELLKSCMDSGAPTINNEDEQLIHNLFPGMV